jgi:hypothetical protein
MLAGICFATSSQVLRLEPIAIEQQVRSLAAFVLSVMSCMQIKWW